MWNQLASPPDKIQYYEFSDNLKDKGKHKDIDL